MDKISGIYQIKNMLNNHRYVGSSSNVYRRFVRHKSDLQNGKHDNIHLQRAWDKYGKESFVFQFLLLCPEKDLSKYEQAYLDRGHCEYNIATCAEASGRNSAPETRAKQSVANAGHPVSEETRAKIRIAKMDNKCALGCIRTKETRAKLSAALKAYWKNKREQLRSV